MAEIIISWILGLIVIAIAWGVTDKLAVRIKTLVKSVQTLKRNKRLENMVAGLLALVALSIMVVAADDYNLGESVGLPALLIWAGGLWLIPFRFDAVGPYWFSSLAIAVILVLFWMVSASPSSRRAHPWTGVPTEQGQEPSTTVTGLGFLFWIFLIGLTVAAIARYTSTWHAAVLNS